MTSIRKEIGHCRSAEDRSSSTDDLQEHSGAMDIASEWYDPGKLV